MSYCHTAMFMSFRCRHETHMLSIPCFFGHVWWWFWVPEERRKCIIKRHLAILERGCRRCQGVQQPMHLPRLATVIAFAAKYGCWSEVWWFGPMDCLSCSSCIALPWPCELCGQLVAWRIGRVQPLQDVCVEAILGRIACFFPKSLSNYLLTKHRTSKPMQVSWQRFAHLAQVSDPWPALQSSSPRPLQRLHLSVWRCYGIEWEACPRSRDLARRTWRATTVPGSWPTASWSCSYAPCSVGVFFSSQIFKPIFFSGTCPGYRGAIWIGVGEMSALVRKSCRRSRRWRCRVAGCQTWYERAPDQPFRPNWYLALLWDSRFALGRIVIFTGLWVDCWIHWSYQKNAGQVQFWSAQIAADSHCEEIFSPLPCFIGSA